MAARVLLIEDDARLVILDLMLPDMDGLALCRTLRVKTDTPVLMLTARGDGPGIPDAERGAVFRPFHRVTRSGETTGSGLGLTLVAQIATRHGGAARYVGRHEEESCFVVTLKTASDDDRGGAARRRDPAGLLPR